MRFCASFVLKLHELISSQFSDLTGAKVEAEQLRASLNVISCATLSNGRHFHKVDVSERQMVASMPQIQTESKVQLPVVAKIFTSPCSSRVLCRHSTLLLFAHLLINNAAMHLL